jgi:hypothetical protein
MTFHRTSLILTALTGLAVLTSSATAAATPAAFATPAQVSVQPPNNADASAARREDPRITQTKLRYQFASWAPAQAEYDGVRFADLKLADLKVVGTEYVPGLPIQQTLADADGVKRVAINWTISSSTKQARTELLGYLTAVNSPNNMPSARGEGIEAGEAGFVGYSKDKRISWIAFNRGNVTVRVNCMDPAADPHPNMGRIAEAIDQLIQLQPLRSDQRPLTVPQVQRLSTSRDACEAGQWIELQLQAENAAHVQWWIGGTGQAYVSKRDGKWMMRTTGPGKVEVRAQVWSANGYFGESVVRDVNVRDDD